MKFPEIKLWVLLTVPICAFAVFILAAFIFLFGSTISELFENHTNPLADPKAGWKLADISKVYNGTEPDAAITKDYQEYLHNLPPNPQRSVLIDPQNLFYEDGTGQHAITIGIAVDGTIRQHVLIYDKSDKRIKVIIYISGHASC